MEKKVKCFQFLILITFIVFFNSGNIYAQKQITTVFPKDGASNVNVGI